MPWHHAQVGPWARIPEHAVTHAHTPGLPPLNPNQLPPRLLEFWHRHCKPAECHSDYLDPRLARHIARSRVECVFELGARDGRDAILLRDYFGATVTAFECNPEAIERCRRTLRGQPGITLVEAAAWYENTTIDFYPVTASHWSDGRPTTDGEGNPEVNIGASSCFPTSKGYLQRYHQDRIQVPAIRLDRYCQEQGIDRIDLLCVDVQGAAFQALAGLGEYIKKVRHVIVELEHRPIYQGQSLLPETDALLQDAGLRPIDEVPRDDWFSDFIYCRTP